MAIKFPYGLASFADIRNSGMVYVDRTAYLQTVETLGRILVFLRPRRFGKSLWLDTLACYYDLAQKDTFPRLFDELTIGRTPTPHRNQYFVLRWDFSRIDPRGNVDTIATSLQEHVRIQARSFNVVYRDHLPRPVDLEGSVDAILNDLLDVAQMSGHAVYLLIDEYDNFINEVMTRDGRLYRGLLESEGPFKLLFKNVKAATQRGLERVFITGVSPVALNDLSSGFNNAKDVTHNPALDTLCGFTTNEVHEVLDRVSQDRELSPEAVTDARAIIRNWYNGYRFVEHRPNLVYNPTSTLYFLEHFAQTGRPPTHLHDENLRTDRSKLEFITQQGASGGLVSALAETGHTDLPLVPERSFSVHDLTSGLREDERIIGSFLFYLGLVTLSEDQPPYLKIPNLAMRKVFLDRLLALYIPQTPDMRAGHNAASRFFEGGDFQVVVDYLEHTFLPILSNRDRGAEAKRHGLGGSGVNETVLKTLLLAILFDDYRYYAFSEPEIGKGYADLCLIVRPELRHSKRFDLLFEFKLVRKKALGSFAAKISTSTDDELRNFPAIKSAFDEARVQLDRYAAALNIRFGDLLRLRCFTVIAVDLDRVLFEEHQ